MKHVELKISNLPTPDIQNPSERIKIDTARLRQIAQDLSEAAQVKITELCRFKIDEHRIDRRAVIFSVPENDVSKIMAFSGCKLESEPCTTIKISTTGKTQGVIGKSKGAGFRNDETDAQLKDHLVRQAENNGEIHGNA